MSGGVDSSVAAYLMVQDGYDCAGATLKLYDNPQCSFPGHRACCTPSDTEDARSVAARLGMLYYVFPMHDEFRHSVIDKFADTYLHGGTPNPCIDCNRFLKFSICATEISVGFSIKRSRTCRTSCAYDKKRLV